MTRTIKASEVKPGMEVRFTITPSMTVNENILYNEYCQEFRDDSGRVARVNSDAKITVLSEPQPEEPTEFGAKVIVDGRQFLRAPLHSSDPTPWLSQLDGIWRQWGYLCNMGTVTVIPDSGWSIPTEAPVVPERIEEWPENDEHLRAHRWKDRSGWIWKHHGEVGGGWTARRSDTSATAFTDDSRPCDGPWTIADEERL